MLAADLVLRHRFAKQGRQGRARARCDAGEQCRTVHADPGESQAARAIGEHAPAAQSEVPQGMLHRIVHQHEMGEIFAALHACAEGLQRAQVEVREHVGIDHRERLFAQPLQGIRDAARGLERLGFRGETDANAEALAVAERRFDLSAQPRVVDHDVAHAAAGQRLDVAHDQRLASHGQQRFGNMVGQRAHALAAAGSQDHRAHRGAQNV